MDDFTRYLAETARAETVIEFFAGRFECLCEQRFKRAGRRRFLINASFNQQVVKTRFDGVALRVVGHHACKHRVRVVDSRLP